jgi:hypothetical protein
MLQVPQNFLLFWAAHTRDQLVCCRITMCHFKPFTRSHPDQKAHDTHASRLLRGGCQWRLQRTRQPTCRRICRRTRSRFSSMTQATHHVTPSRVPLPRPAAGPYPTQPVRFFVAAARSTRDQREINARSSRRFSRTILLCSPCSLPPLVLVQTRSSQERDRERRRQFALVRL